MDEELYDYSYISDDRVDSIIKNVQYHHFPNTTLIVCAIELQNGFFVSGESYCVPSKYFNTDVGNTIAFENARTKIWDLEMYLLSQENYNKEMDKDVL